MQPIHSADLPPDFPKFILQSTESYSPLAYISGHMGSDDYFDVKLLGKLNAFENLVQYRGNTKTPTALIHHHRFSCASEKRLQNIQECTVNMHIQHKLWKAL